MSSSPVLISLSQPDNADFDVPEMNISYKPQALNPRYPGKVQDLLFSKIRNNWMHPQFKTDVAGMYLVCARYAMLYI
jgi:ATP-binding cassette, sub-family E, member 1